MTLKSKKGEKLIQITSTLVIILILVPSFLFFKPEKANAQIAAFDVVTEINTSLITGTSASGAISEAMQTGIAWKEVAKEVIRQSLMALAKNALKRITQSTVNWINSGFHGAPLFLSNSESFFKDIGKYEVKTLIDEIGYNSLEMPFGRSYALNAIDSYKKQLDDNLQYSMSKVINDPVTLINLRNDFNVGGWNGFLMNTQYPQNNYIGYTLMVDNELARRFNGVYDNNAGKVQDALQKGMGFLSPQKCLTNPNFNNLSNQFNKPKFNASTAVPWNFVPTVDEYDSYGQPNPEYEAQLAAYQATHDAQVNAERNNWASDNDCPPRPDGSSGFEDTTPGSVVSAQITNAMGSQIRQTELSTALGSSLSTVFDALLNKFLGDGLNALATRVNPEPPPDDWNYNGLTLGSPGDDASDPWNSGPDEEIILDNFKKELNGKTIVTVSSPDGATTTIEKVGNTGDGVYVPGSIANTKAELALIFNDKDPLKPGLFQIFTEIWKETRVLDKCIPGPDLNWRDRTEAELTKNRKLIEEHSQDGDDEDQTEVKADLVLRELLFAVNFFKDWVDNKMMMTLPASGIYPGSVSYIDAVEELETLSDQAKEIILARRTKTQALARAEAVSAGLAGFTIQPTEGSPEEATLVKLRKQYNATRSALSSTSTIDDRTNDLDIAKDKFFRLQSLVPKCEAQRTANGWSNPGGPLATLFGGDSDPKTIVDPADEPPSLLNQVQIERAKYGAIPTKEEMGAILSTVAKNNSAAGWGVLKKNPIQNHCPTDWGDAGCDILFNAKSCLTYDVFLGNPELTPQWNLDTHYDRSEWLGDGGWATAITPPCAPYTITDPGGTELGLFCERPVVRGYPHEMFQKPSGCGFWGFGGECVPPSELGQGEYKYLPLINAADVLTWDKYAWGTGDASASIYMSCDIIFNANVLDYKGDLPGLTGVDDRKPEWTQNPGGGSPGGVAPPPSEPGVPPPVDAETKHGNHEAEVQAAKDSMIAEGYTFEKGIPDCDAATPMVNDRLELMKRTARLIGNDNGVAGLLEKTSGTNCGGYSSDIIAFPDGYIYDAINGTASDGQGAGWTPSACGPNPGPGTCPERYRPAP